MIGTDLQSSIARPSPVTVAGGNGRRPRLLVIGPTPPPYNGMTTVMETVLASPVLREAFDVVHLDTADRRSLANMGRFDLTNAYLALRHASQLVAMILRYRPDVIYLEVSQNAWAYLRDALLISIGKTARCQVVARLNGSYFREFYRTTNPACRWLIRQTSRALSGAAVLSEGLRPIYAGLLPEERVHVVPNGIPDLFDDAIASRERDAARPITITYLGALMAPKGIFDLLEAVPLVAREEPLVRFVLAGSWASGAEQLRAQQMADRHGLDDMVTFAGVVAGEAKRELLLGADILVFPGCQAEGQPFVILEAMAAGLPVVATPVGAVPEMVVHEGTGLVVPPRDPVKLSRALLHLARDAEARRRLGRAGRKLFLERFTDTRSVEQLVRVLEIAAARG